MFPRKLIVVSIVVGAFFLLKCSHAQNVKTQNGIQDSINKVHLAEEVKKEFLHAWNGYKKYAWGHDALLPLSKGYRDWYGVSLYMTPVDAFDTMKLMKLEDQANETKALILDSLSFNHDISVQTFEITIRLLGGLLSCYNLDGDKKFLNLAEDLGKRLLPSFDSKTGMPFRYVNLISGKTDGNVSNPAEIGTLMIEFGTLSKLTQNPIYYKKAKKAVVELFKRRSKLDLVGSSINVETGEWVNTTSHIRGGIDSYYEYLLKSWLLFGDNDFKEMWETSIKAVNKYLADSSETGFWFAQADMNSGQRTSTNFGALDAFFPAVLALNGNLKLAESLEASCFKMWNLEGIEPETINFNTMEITSPYYVLRPEIIESAYYLYHFTHDEKYLQMGKTFFDNVIKYCKTDEGFAALESVITKEKSDDMESFFLAETMKYFYLLFAPENTLNFNEIVFNTEAHPIPKVWVK